MHVAGGNDVDASDASWGGQSDRSGNQRDLCAGSLCGSSESKSLLARTVIADVANRIDGFARGPGSDQHAAPSEARAR